MSKRGPLTIQLKSATIARLYEIAQRRNLSVDYIIEVMLQDHFRYLEWLEVEIEKGLEDIRQGRFYTQEQVEERFRNRGVALD